MPHFILDCSENILEIQSPKKVLEAVFQTAFETGLFQKEAIKVRMNPYKHSLVLGGNVDFIHVFANIMEGRNTTQKKNLSEQIVLKLKEMFPKTSVISINIRDFEKSTYCNKTMV